jgi:hypothetical protein
MSENEKTKLDAVTVRLLFHKRHGRIYFEKAEKALLKRGKDMDFVRFEDAANYFFKSSISYMACTRWREAGESLIRCAQMRSRLKMKGAAAAMYTQAAESFLKADKDAALEAFISSISIYVDLGKFEIAGVLERKVAHIHYLNKHWEEAAEHFQRAGNYLTGEVWRDQSDLCYERQAQCYIEQSDYFEEASMIYEKIAGSCVRTNLRRFHARDYLFRAILCLAAAPLPTPQAEEDSDELDQETAENAEEKYSAVIWKVREFEAIDFMWKTSKEALFLLNIMYARLDLDEDELADHLYYWNNIRPLDRICLKLLTVVKDEIRGELMRQADKKKRSIAGADKAKRRRARFERKRLMMEKLGVEINEEDIEDELDQEDDKEEEEKEQRIEEQQEREELGLEGGVGGVGDGGTVVVTSTSISAGAAGAGAGLEGTTATTGRK